MQRLSYAMMEALVKSKVSGGEANTVIVDVRGHDEVSSTGMIPSANNVPLDQLESALKLAAKDFQSTYNFPKPEQTDRVVTYCLKGMRAEKAAALFVASGYKHVDVYPGSWSEWAANHQQ